MSKLSFVKFQGAGNDFILIDDRTAHFPTHDRALIQKMCHRQFGIGADGLILLSSDPQADFRMRIFNSDGLEASSCGNGLRCLVQFLLELGVIQETYRIRTQEKTVEASLANGHPVIDLGPPENVRIQVETDVGIVHCIDTGAPHAVHFVPNVDAIDVSTAGRALRRHLQSNINFAALNGDRSIHVRTYEKGVEGETLSCGTGAVAVASIASRLHGLEWPISLHFRGGKLEVWEKDGRLFLSGPAEKVFAGIFP